MKDQHADDDIARIARDYNFGWVAGVLEATVAELALILELDPGAAATAAHVRGRLGHLVRKFSHGAVLREIEACSPALKPLMSQEP